jgi:hypothetical protein
VAAVPARRDKIVEHLVRRVEAAQAEDAPFQHVYLTDVFPADVYGQIMANLPERKAYRPLNIKRWHNDRGESTRDQLFLSEGEIERIEASKRDLWSDITAALESEDIRRALFAKFRHDVALRLGCPADEVLSRPMYPSVSLVRDFKDYKIKPHPDGHPRVVTMQFYLPHDETQADLGTSLYKKLPVAYRLLGRTFEEVKRFPFLPNSAYAFAVNDCDERQSFHGRETIGESSAARDTILAMWLSSPMAFAARHNSDMM